MFCPVCLEQRINFYINIDKVDYFECFACSSLFADPDFLEDIDNGKTTNYSSEYWQDELISARERSFGSSLVRVAEVFLYSRRPISQFIDIGTGPGYLLDALSSVMPASSSLFHGVELFPPEKEYCTKHPNYCLGVIDDFQIKFDGGTCIEVIEHITPNILKKLIHQLSLKSQENAVFYFNSAQPSFVKQNNNSYLDPYGRGHIISYSIKGLTPIFSSLGFNLIPLPGRDWAFLAEYSPEKKLSAEDLLSRIWTALPENVDKLKDKAFGPLMYTMGVEGARCYLEAALCEERTAWALASNALLEKRDCSIDEK